MNIPVNRSLVVHEDITLTEHEPSQRGPRPPAPRLLPLREACPRLVAKKELREWMAELSPAQKRALWHLIDAALEQAKTKNSLKAG